MPNPRRRLWLRMAAAGTGLALFLLVAELLAALLLRVAAPASREGADETQMPHPAVWKARDEDRPRAKDWFRYRIVCLGDSCTYGIGLTPPETYPAQLEALLNAGQPFQRYEVINLGIAGYTSEMGLRRLREVALSFQPDLVIASFGLNDKWRAERSDREKTALERSAGVRLRLRLAEVLERFHLYRLLRLALGPLLERKRQVFAGLEVEYRVPLAEYRENLQALARETRAAGAEFVLFSMAETPAIEKLTAEGLAAFERGDHAAAVERLERCAQIGYMYYPRPMHFLALAHQALGNAAAARRAQRAARQFARIFPFPHLVPVELDRIRVRSHLDGVVLEPQDHFDIYARYRAAAAELARAEDVPYADMTSRGLKPGDFFDYCHLLRPGYAKVAAAVHELVVRDVLPRQTKGAR